jgi:hypothetical protein
VPVKFSNQTSLLQRNQTVVNISYMAGKFLSLCHGSFQRLNFKPKTPATGHVESCVQLEAAALLLPNSNLHLSGVCRVPTSVCAPRRHKADARAVCAGTREERQRSVVSAPSALPTPSSNVGQLNQSVSKCPVWSGQFGKSNVSYVCAPCKGGAFLWVPTPPGQGSSRKQPERSWR